jgi:hypothetical protein
MALNFGLLDQGGPTNFFEGYSQGQEKMQANAMAQQRAVQAQQEFGMRQQEFAAGQAEKKRLSTAAIVTQRTLAARDAILNARTPGQARAIERAQHADEYLGPIRRQFGSLEADLADIPDEPTAFEQWKEKQAMGATEFLKRQASNREFAAAISGAPQTNAMGGTPAPTPMPMAAAPAPAPTPTSGVSPSNIGAETFISTGVGAPNFNGTATRFNPTTGDVEPVPDRDQAAAGLFDKLNKTYSPAFGTLALTTPQILTRLNNKLAALTDNPPEGMTPQIRAEMIAATKEEIIATAAGKRDMNTPTNAMAPQAPAAAAVANAMAPVPASAVAPPQTQLQSLVDQYERFSRKPNPDKRDENRIKFLTEEIARVSKRNLHTVAGVGLVDADTNKIVYASQEKGTLLSQLQTDLAAATDPKVRKEIQAKINKEISHQPATSVTVSTEKTYGGKLADKLADRDDAKLGAAEKAPQLAESANRIISLVNQGNLFTGPIAGIKLNIARYLNVAGASNEEKISNTESLIAATGQSTLDAIKSAGLGTGQGFTDKDLKFLQQIAGGTFELTPQTLTRLATLQHQAAVRSVEAWNTRFTQIPSSATGALGLSTVPKISPLVGSSTSSGFKYLGKESN